MGSRNLLVTMVITHYMEVMIISTMQTGIYMNLMTMKKMENKIIVDTSSCMLHAVLSPGMNFNISKDNNNQSYVYVEIIQEKVIIENINKNSDLSLIEERPYRIGRRSNCSYYLGLPEVFPITNISPDQNLRRVDSNGNIYFHLLVA